jgi:hypothetical protein
LELIKFEEHVDGAPLVSSTAIENLLR